MTDREMEKVILDEYREAAAEHGITLQEYMLFLVLGKLEDIECSLDEK